VYRLSNYPERSWKGNAPSKKGGVVQELEGCTAEVFFFCFRLSALRPNSVPRAPHQHILPSSATSTFCEQQLLFKDSTYLLILPISRIRTVCALYPTVQAPSWTHQTTQPLSHLSDLHLSPRSLRSSSPVSMASTSASPDTSATSSPKKYNLRNPLPLSASQEQEVKQMYYKRVRARCAPEIKGT
jgi:hypothetical protein